MLVLLLDNAKIVFFLFQMKFCGRYLLIVLIIESLMKATFKIIPCLFPNVEENE